MGALLLILGLLALLAALFPVKTVPFDGSDPDIPAAEPAAPGTLDKLPVFVLPRADREAGNGLQAVFVQEHPAGESGESGDGAGGSPGGKADRVLEVTAVFLDEDHPAGLMDWLYDQFRARGKYKRKADVETFRLFFQSGSAGGDGSSGGDGESGGDGSGAAGKSAGELVKADFTHVYSGEQTFYEEDITHYDGEVPGEAFARDPETGRILLYVNTWNHMFAEENTNPGREDLERLREFPVYRGGRETVEGFYR